MFKSKLQKILFGRTSNIVNPKGRVSYITIPKTDDTDKDRIITMRNDDGLIFYFLKRIEGLEQRLEHLEIRAMNAKVK